MKNNYLCLFLLAVLPVLVFSGCTGRKIDSQLKRAEGLKGTRKIDEALQVYKLITTRYPRDLKSAEAYIKMGDLYLHHFKKEDEAIDSYYKVKETWPLSRYAREAAVKAAEFYDVNGEKRRAIGEYEWVLMHFPDDVDRHKFRLRIAEEYLDILDPYQASVEIEELLKNDDIEDEVRARAMFDLGEGYLFQNKHEDALKTFTALEERYPDIQFILDARLRMVECLEKLGRDEESIRLQERLVKTYPDSELVKKRLEASIKRVEKTDKPE